MMTNVSSDARYTLDEARVELTKQECSRFGHSWDVVEQFGGPPIKIVCSRCGASHNITSEVTA